MGERGTSTGNALSRAQGSATNTDTIVAVFGAVENARDGQPVHQRQERGDDERGADEGDLGEGPPPRDDDDREPAERTENGCGDHEDPERLW